MVYKFFLINLVERPDRLETVKQELSKLGIKKIFAPKFYKHPKGGRAGCIDSHMQIWNHKRLDDDDTVIIFEDDIQYSLDNPKIFWKRLKEAEALLNSDMCEIVNLSGQILSYKTRLSRHFFKGVNITAASYVSKGHILKSLPDRLYSLERSHIDTMMLFSANVAIPYEQIFKQADFNDSDNQWVRFKLFDSFLRKFIVTPKHQDSSVWNTIRNSIIRKNVAWYLLEDQNFI